MTSKLIERLINKEYLTERERKEWLNAIKERLGKLKKENKELKETIEIRKQMNINLINFGSKLQLENEKLKKALELACEMLGDWDCPVSQDLIYDLDCEACCDNYKECWKKYFMKTVV